MTLPGQFNLSDLELRVHRIVNDYGVRENRDKEFGNDDDPMDGDSIDADDDADAGYYDEWDPWLKIYYIEIITKDGGKKIGRFGVRTVHETARSLVGGQNLPFRLVASERGGSDLEFFGTTLFSGFGETDRGQLREKYLSGPSVGTGVFGNELNYGSFAYISADYTARDDFFIKPEFRGQGIGSWALQELFGHSILRGIDFLFVQPGPTDITPQQRSDIALVRFKVARVERFYRKAGFRRVGKSLYFGYSLRNPEHPSRWLAMEDDCGSL